MKTFEVDDGGRKAAGFKGSAGDCACRALAIACEMAYEDAYRLINETASHERPARGRSRSSARTGVWMPTMRRVMQDLGWEWKATMSVGSGCRVHLKASELPAGRIIAQLSGHFVAVVDGVVRDTYDSSRDGTRCVYGFWFDPKAGGGA